MSISEGLEIESCATDGRVRARRANALKVVNDCILSLGAWTEFEKGCSRSACSGWLAVEGVLNRTTFDPIEQMTFM